MKFTSTHMIAMILRAYLSKKITEQEEIIKVKKQVMLKRCSKRVFQSENNWHLDQIFKYQQINKLPHMIARLLCSFKTDIDYLFGDTKNLTDTVEIFSRIEYSTSSIIRTGWTQIFVGPFGYAKNLDNRGRTFYLLNML